MRSNRRHDAEDRSVTPKKVCGKALPVPLSLRQRCRVVVALISIMSGT